ncbi:44993_t:CDS:2, partial [Gigaspora margarita]
HVKSTKENGVTKQTFYPFRVDYKYRTEIKELQILKRIVQGNILNSQLPGFCCEANRISGPQIMGFDDQKILSELISDIPFQPFNISIDKLSAIIYSIDIFLNKDWNYADPNDMWSQTRLLKAINENDNIIELHQSLGEIYPKNYEISDQKLRAWHAILNATSCTNITPKSHDFTKEKNLFDLLYQTRFLCSISSIIPNSTEIFWDYFKQSLDNNKRGLNGKQRILLIIAHYFPYQILRQKLQISPNTINTAKMYARINGYGCSVAPKPLM